MEETVHPVFPWLNAARRAWLYRVVVAVVSLVGAYGVVDGSRAGVLVALVAAVLGTGTAAAHTPTSE